MDDKDRRALLLIFTPTEIDDLDTVAAFEATDRQGVAHRALRDCVRTAFRARGATPAGRWPSRPRP